jgi:hypothetical protein
LLATVAEADVARVLMLAERDELRQTLAESNKRYAEATAREIANGALEWRLEQSEAECRRLIAERDGALAKRTARRLRRDAAVRALLESAQHEQLARRWIVRCGHLEQMLEMARAEFQQLAQWAHERVEPSHPDVAVPDAQPAPPGSDVTPS